MADVTLHEWWARAEAAHGLPDDGIVDWSLTLWHDPSGWHAEGWRSDTTAHRTGTHPTPEQALEQLGDMAGVADG
jgi:hypothetical protein